MSAQEMLRKRLAETEAWEARRSKAWSEFAESWEAANGPCAVERCGLTQSGLAWSVFDREENPHIRLSYRGRGSIEIDIDDADELRIWLNTLFQPEAAK